MAVLLANPLTLVYDEFWAQLEATADLAALIKEGNRIKFNKRDPTKETISHADTPEIRVIPVGASFTPTASNLRGWTEEYEIGVVTGRQELGDILMPLRWMLRKAVYKVEVELPKLDLSAFEGGVIQVKPTAIRDGVSERDLARGIDGWMSFWTVDVELRFSAAILAT